MRTFAKRKCEHCSKLYEPGSGSQRWCLECRYECHRRQQNERRRERYTPKPKQKHNHKPKMCEFCGSTYKPTSSTQKRCRECSVWVNKTAKPRQTPSPKPAQKQPDGWKRGGVAVLRLGE